MKLQCHKCQKNLTVDLLPVKSYRKMFEYEWGVDHIDMEGDVYYDWIKSPNPRRVVFVNKTKPYAWTWKDYLGVDTKQEAIDFYGEKEANLAFSMYNMIKSNPAHFIVHEDDMVEGVIPPFEEGGGCCNWSLGELLECECGTVLGEMNLDCYEDQTVHLYENSVRRVYE